MSKEISFVLITPGTLAKGRTGALLARLLPGLGLELLGMQLMRPDRELAAGLAEALGSDECRQSGESASMKMKEYLLNNFIPNRDSEERDGRRPSETLFLLFRGEGALERTATICRSIRAGFGDLIEAPGQTGRILYFEPALLWPSSAQELPVCLKLFASKLEKNPVLPAVNPDLSDSPFPQEKGSRYERTLVILKPDNWRYPSLRPGEILDIFSTTGLHLHACKLYRMSVNEAKDFYAPVRKILLKKLSPGYAKKAAILLSGTFEVDFDEQVVESLRLGVGLRCAEDQFNRIIEFMTGIHPEKCVEDEASQPGGVTSLVLVYEGPDAVARIRDVLGPTDPAVAPPGTVRREFGRDVMVNAAHASDSVENAEREMAIVLPEENDLSDILHRYLV